MKKMISRDIKKLYLINPQLTALQQLGFEYIIIGKQEKRLYAFFDTEIRSLKDYAKYDGIALNVNLLPRFVLDKLEPDVFYKII